MTNPPSEFPASPSQPDAGGPSGVPQSQNPQPPVYPQAPQQPPTYSQPAVPQTSAYPTAGGPPQPPQYPQGQQYPQAPQGPVTPKGLAITALIVGIVAFLTGLVPVLGIILGIAGVILGSIALAKKQPKGFALTGLILSVVGAIVSIFATLGLFVFGAVIQEELNNPTVQTQAPSTPSESAPETEPDAPATEDFPEVSAAELAEIVSDPAAWAGTDMMLFGTVVQFDEGTGLCSMRLTTGHAAQTDPDLYEHNTLAYAGDWESDCPVLDPVYVGDNVAMAVTVLGEEIYETSAGESISALQVELWAVEVL